jgi:hypothetical protein
MSALTPKADMCGALAHVCLGPIADMVAPGRKSSGHRRAGHTAKSMDSRILRAAPVRMLSRICAPAEAQEVELLRVAEEMPQLHEEAVGHVPQPKGSDVLTPTLRATGTHGVFGAGLCRSR